MFKILITPAKKLAFRLRSWRFFTRRVGLNNCLAFLACSCCLFLFAGCSSVQVGKVFKPVSIDNLSQSEIAKLSCSIESGLQSETDYALVSRGSFSLGWKLPSSLDQEMNYERNYDEYTDCLRNSGL